MQFTTLSVNNGVVQKLATYVILSISQDGYKEVFTIEVVENEISKYWLSVLNGLKNRFQQGLERSYIHQCNRKSEYYIPQI